MSIRVALEHRTSYRFDRPVRLSPHVVRLRPAPHCRTPVLSYSLTVTPRNHFINWQQDPFGNQLARLVFPEPARELTVTVDLVADLVVVNPFDFFVEESAARYPFSYDAALARELAAYLSDGSDDEPSPLLAQWLQDWSNGPASPGPDGQAIVDFLVALNQLVFRSVAYTTRMEAGVQTPDETLEKKLGSCRDSAWLLVQILRRLGFAARFVSGYLVQLRPDDVPLDGPPGPLADFTDLHAWAEAYLPGAGWIGLDPTSGLLAGEGHLPLVCSPHPSSAAPISGAIEPCEVTLECSNTVRRLHGPPRVTLPYSDEQWRRIDALGHEVDKALGVGDVRLTFGGEPTFVATDDMEDAQWTTAADGVEKGPGGRRSPGAFSSVSRRAASSITARVSGTRANLCPGGRSPCSGELTGCRCGTTRPYSPISSAPVRQQRAPMGVMLSARLRLPLARTRPRLLAPSPAPSAFLTGAASRATRTLCTVSWSRLASRLGNPRPSTSPPQTGRSPRATPAWPPSPLSTTTAGVTPSAG